MATTWVQTNFRFREDDGSETTAAWIDAVDTNITRTVTTSNSTLRIRIAAQQTGTTAATLTGRLYVSKNGGAYAQITTTATDGCKVVASANITDDEATTQQITAATFVAGKMDDVNGQTSATGSITQNKITEHEYMLQFDYNNLANGDYFDFRERNSTTAFTTYTVTGQVTISKSAPGSVLDSYAETNADGFLYVPEFDGTIEGQSFNCSASGNIIAADFWLKLEGTPTGNLTASLYAHTGTYGTGTPTGAALATSENVDIAGTLTTTAKWVTFVFGTPYAVVSGTKYFVVLNIPAETSGNNVLIGEDSSTPTHGGCHSGWFTDHWDSFSGAEDTPFAVYYTATATGKPYYAYAQQQ